MKDARRFRKKRSVTFLFLALLVFAGQAMAAQSYEMATVAENGMVATARQLASEAALEVLKNGGNAVDAAAVAQFVLNVVEPYMTGIGGGNFMMIYWAETGQVVAIDAREEAPARYHERVFYDAEGNIIPWSDRATGGNAVGVPGTLAGIAKALEMFGTLSLAEALQPAIALAENGFRLQEDDAAYIRAEAERLKRFPASVALFFREDGTPLQAGDLLVNKDLANTFRLIAEQGIDVFYKGEIADDIVAAVRNAPYNPGVMEKTDLEGYRAVLREPVRGTYRGYEIASMGPPTSGGMTLIEMLNILEAYDLRRLGWGTLDGVHIFNEAQKIAFADRNRYMADADFVDVPVAGLVSKGFAAQRRALIDPVKALPAPVAPGDPWAFDTAMARPGVTMASTAIPSQEGAHTTHFSVVDKDRNVVSITSTIERVFGSAIVVPGRGFLLNNELTDFDAEPHRADGSLVANRPEGGKQLRRTSLDAADTYGGKRPRSSMTPTLIFKDGKPFMAVGSPGGSRIIGIVLNVITNVIDHGMDPQQAITAPRIVNRGGAVEMEPEFYDANPELVAALKARGHDVTRVNSPFGGAQAIVIDPETGLLLGGADPRRNGYVAGY